MPVPTICSFDASEHDGVHIVVPQGHRVLLTYLAAVTLVFAVLVWLLYRLTASGCIIVLTSMEVGMPRSRPPPLTPDGLRQSGRDQGTEIAAAIIGTMTGASAFSVDDFEADVRDRFDAWMAAMHQFYMATHNLSDGELKVWDEAALAALNERL